MLYYCVVGYCHIGTTTQQQTENCYKDKMYVIEMLNTLSRISQMRHGTLFMKGMRRRHSCGFQGLIDLLF